MRRFVVILTIGLAFGLPTPARAEQGSAVCTFNYDNGVVSPGLLASESRAAQWSAGPAPINCTGSVNGQEITGPGVIREYGTLEGTCRQGKGTGVQIATLPTAKGTVVIENDPAPFTWSGPAGPYDGPRLRGTFEFWPMAGNCLTEPVTRYGQLTQGVITGS